MFNEINKSIDAAISSGAQYADARILISKSRDISAKDGELEDLTLKKCTDHLMGL